MARGKTDRKNRSMLSAVTAGSLVSVVISFLLTAAAAGIVISGYMQEGAIMYIGYIIFFLSVLFGSLISGKNADGKRGIACFAAAAAYVFVILSSNIVFFNGVFSDFWVNILLAVLGSGLSCVLLTRKKPGKMRKKYRYM